MKKLLLALLCSFALAIQIDYPLTSSADIAVPGVLPSWVVTQNYYGGNIRVPSNYIWAQNFVADAGTNSNCAYNFSGAASTGMYFPSNELSLQVAGIEGVHVKTGGNIGIGTTAPRTLLDVAGTVSASALVVNGYQAMSGGSNAAGIIGFSDTGTRGGLKFYTKVDGQPAGEHMKLNMNGTIATTYITGNVGINLGQGVEPASTLQVGGQISATSINVSSQPYLYMSLNGNSNLPNGGAFVITLNARTQDAAQIITYNTLTGQGTILQAGGYLFVSSVYYNMPAATGYARSYIYVNSAIKTLNNVLNPSAGLASATTPMSWFGYLSAGATFSLQYATNLASGLVADGSTGSTFLQVIKLF